MRYVGDWISDVRYDSRNRDEPSSTEELGIANSSILRHLNYGQNLVAAKIIAAQSDLFKRTIDVDITANENTISVDDNVWLGTDITNVKYSYTGLAKDLRDLPQIGHNRLSYDTNNRVLGYARQGQSLLLSPTPNVARGMLRVQYNRSPEKLALRAGTIASHTDSGTAITALSIDTSDDDATGIASFIASEPYISVCDVNGNVTMANILVTAYDDGTGAFTLNHTYATGESITNGDYITLGRYTSTHCQLPSTDLIESTILLHATMKAFGRDSSIDIEDIKEELSFNYKEIVMAYGLANRDEGDIQIEDHDIMDLDMGDLL